MKLHRLLILALCLLPAAVSCGARDVHQDVQAGQKTPKYVFFMLGDGMGMGVTYNAGLYRGGPQALPSFTGFPVVGITTTYSNDDFVTDSSAAGVAIYSGIKTNNSSAGTAPDGSPVESVIQQAKRLGWGAGMVTTNGINHATPAAIGANVKSRKEYDEIARQILSSDIDVLGGSTVLSNDADGREKWLSKASGMGWNVFVGKKSFKACDGKALYVSDKVYGEDLAYAIDRRPDDVELADFTRLAIDHLMAKYSEEGFLLFIEGGSIDHACHSNDAKTAFEEVLDFEKSVNMVMAFAAEHPDETLIVVCVDHDTGGLTLSKPYDLSLLANQKSSMSETTARLAAFRDGKTEVTWEQVKAVLKETLGYWDTFQPGAKEEEVLRNLYNKSFKGKMEPVKDLYHTNEPVAAEAVSFLTKKAGLRWTNRSHTSSPTPYFVMGAGCGSFQNCHDNTDLATRLRALLGWE